MTSFGELRGGLARQHGGRVNLTERQRGRQREPAVSVARTAAALGLCRSSGLPLGTVWRPGLWLGPWKLGLGHVGDRA
jgi:hypothetical protein